MVMGAAHAQTSSPKFDVISIRPNTSGLTTVIVGPIMLGRFTASNITVDHLIRLAYDVQEYQIVGAPSWTKSAAFDIAAKADGMDKATYREMQPLLQSLLADRFRLTLHHETRDLPLYELVAAKGGPKLVPAKEGSCSAFDPKNPPPPQPGGALPRICGASWVRKNSLQIVGSSMPGLASNLAGLLGRPVVDKTGLTGKFDIDLEFAADDAIAIGGTASSAADASRPSIFTALQEQLGLKLESSKGPDEVMVIDHVEQPDEN
jgi:uncharacterized protein (TIGR03435 family)